MPPFGVNLTALVSRFQTTCCSRSGSPDTGPGVRIDACLRSRMPLASAAGRTDSTAASTIGGELDPLHVEPDLAGDDPVHVEQVLDQLRLRARVALDRLEARGAVSASSASRAQQDLGPAEDRVERRAQLVRERREELVLHQADALDLGARRALGLEQPRALVGGALRLLVQPRVVDRDRGLRRDADDQPLGALGEDAGLGVAEEQPADAPRRERAITGTAR